ncbi:MAG TPA: tetratricopeptide repeat protein [Tepidisphaeraceae bacterium]|jgi:predicted O-linked N-acetylglucosamine transferase (SPINDLY family)
MSSTEDILRSAQRLHQAGQLADAEALYREVLHASADDRTAMHLLGLVLFQTGRGDEARGLLEKSVAGRQTPPEFFFNAAVVLDQLGETGRAATLYERAIALRHNYPEALNNLSTAYTRLGRLREAIDLAQRAAGYRPGWNDPLFNLAQATKALAIELHFKRLLTPAIDLYRNALAHRPDDPLARVNLAVALAENDEFEAAKGEAHQVIERSPQLADGRWALGFALEREGKVDEAMGEYRMALWLPPVPALRVGTALPTEAQVGRAIAFAREAVGMNPSHISTLVSVAGVLARTPARGDDAAGAYLDLLRMQPELPDVSWVLGNRLLSLHYQADVSPPKMFLEHQRLGALLERVEPIQAREERADESRKLRIGYVSADFRAHSVMGFLEPVLAHHDRSRFEIFCYSNGAAADETTLRVQGYAVNWRPIAGESDAGVAKLIRDDAIDLLVDLSGHTSGNRLGVFALRPAPVQVTCLGYPDTTGMMRMDYRLTDRVADSPETAQALATEKLAYLSSAWCYTPGEGTPEVSPLPALRNGHITFGCFNTIRKVTREMASVWSEILRRVQGSRLMLKSAALEEPAVQRQICGWFEEEVRQRVTMLPASPTVRTHLAMYSDVDIALDTYPYGGTTTTCEAMWMGAAVVTQSGAIHASRVGHSLLRTAGLEELVATSGEQYVKIAENLARDRNRLAAMRQAMRDRLRQSPLLDGARFTLELEGELLKMWQRRSLTRGSA